MKKSLIALAVVGAFAAPAFAATSNVDIGGTINMSVDYLDADSADQGGNWNVSNNSSNIYFKGTEDLGGGLKAIWQVQTYFTAGGTGGTGDTGVAGEAVPDGVGSGNTYVGLSGNFGTVMLGKMEAPAKMIGRSVDLFGDQIGDNRNLTTRVGSSLGTFFADVDGAVSGSKMYSGGFDLRPNNVIAYVTPTFNGLTGAIAYVTNVGDAGATWDDSADAWSGSVKYENGPLMIGLGYQVHNLSEMDAALGDEQAWRLAAGYSFGATKVVAFYQKEDDLNYVTLTGGVPTAVNNNVDRTTWGLGVAHSMGPITLKAQYYTADDAQAADTGADMWAVGADYDLSKRTKVQFAYVTTDNDKSAKYSAFGGGHGDQPTMVSGGSPNGFSVGVKHTF